MHTSVFVALTLGNMATAAQLNGRYMNTTTPVTNMSSTVSQKPTSTPVVNPETIADVFSRVGCLKSSAGFPGFKLLYTSGSNSLDLCAASCPSKYFGVNDDECFCGDKLELSSVTRADNAQCNIKCPGNAKQNCGGQVGKVVRQIVPTNDLLSVYERIADDGSSSSAVTTTPATTKTQTVTSTVTGTVTSCPPEVTDCPIGQKTTEVKTLTTTWCPEEHKKHHDWHKKKIVCYGNWCVPEDQCHGPDCEHHRVICEGDVCWTEECPADQWDKLVICQNGECHYASWDKEADCQHKVVCFDGKCTKEKCYGDECHKKMVCNDDHCDYKKCNGDDCWKKESCKSDQCKPEVPCKGDNCPQPPAPKPKPTNKPNPNPNPKPTQTVCNGENCGNKGGNTGGNQGGNGGNGDLPPVVHAGSVRSLPAIGITLIGAVAGVAFLL